MLKRFASAYAQCIEIMHACLDKLHGLSVAQSVMCLLCALRSLCSAELQLCSVSCAPICCACLKCTTMCMHTDEAQQGKAVHGKVVPLTMQGKAIQRNAPGIV